MTWRGGKAEEVQGFSHPSRGSANVVRTAAAIAWMAAPWIDDLRPFVKSHCNSLDRVRARTYSRAHDQHSDHSDRTPPTPSCGMADVRVLRSCQCQPGSVPRHLSSKGPARFDPGPVSSTRSFAVHARQNFKTDRAAANGCLRIPTWLRNSMRLRCRQRSLRRSVLP